VGRRTPPEYKGANLSLIIDTYEKAAIRSETRAGALVASLSPLYACRQIAESSQKTLEMLAKKHTENLSGVGETPEESYAKQSNTSSADDSSCAPNTVELEPVQSNFTTPQVPIAGWETDPWEAIGDWLGLDPEVLNSTNMEECFGCDLRMELNWELPSVNLVLPLQELLTDMESSIEGLSARIDPYGMLEDLCKFFDGLNLVCIPDLVTMLVSIKLLLRKYITFGLELKLDWTAIIGPLLKMIVDSLASLVNQIQSIVLAPIDCILGALEMGEQLINQSADTWNTALAAGQALGRSVSAPADSVTITPNSEVVYKASAVHAEGQTTFSKKVAEALKAPSSTAIGSFEKAASGSGGTKTGFVLQANSTLEAALEQRDFHPPDVLQTTILALRDARKYVEELFAMVMYSLKSLNAFMSNGLGFQLKNSGMLLLLMDIISLVLLVMKMKQQGINIKDWCKELDNKAEHSKLLNAISSQYPGTTVSMAEDRPAILINDREIPLCPSDRNRVEGKEVLLEQWLQDLESHVGRG